MALSAALMWYYVRASLNYQRRHCHRCCDLRALHRRFQHHYRSLQKRILYPQSACARAPTTRQRHGRASACCRAWPRRARSCHRRRARVTSAAAPKKNVSASAGSELSARVSALSCAAAASMCATRAATGQRARQPREYCISSDVACRRITTFGVYRSEILYAASISLHSFFDHLAYFGGYHYFSR